MQSRRVEKAKAAFGIAMFALCACGQAGRADQGQTQQPLPAKKSLAAAGPAAADLSLTDRNALELARSACAARDFPGLFTAMASSAAVRRKYTANSIEVSLLDQQGATLSSSLVASNAYDGFPVRQVDYYYKPARPVIAGDQDEYLDVEFNQSQDDVFSVDWARVHYDGNSEGGDDLGRIIGPDGAPLPPGEHPRSDGQLLFKPTSDCWQLEADIRWRR